MSLIAVTEDYFIDFFFYVNALLHARSKVISLLDFCAYRWNTYLLLPS